MNTNSLAASRAHESLMPKSHPLAVNAAGFSSSYDIMEAVRVSPYLSYA